MTITLRPIKPKKISDQVFEQIKELIFRGQLKPGEQLMPERELSDALGVSRTTVRNAINKLVVMGLLEHRQGQGTFARSPETWHEGNPLAAAMNNQEISLQDLLEVRMGLECNAAALAARRAVEADLEFLEKSMMEMRKATEAGDPGVEADTSFHMAIAYATKNPFHVYIMKNFYDLLFIGIKKNLLHLYQNPDNVEKILNQHQSICDSIRLHNPDLAFDNMKTHITFVIDYFKAQLPE